jgi:DNA-binding NarL/FixJ family response regulator
MKYINANVIFPEELLKQLQKFISGGYVCVPEPKSKRKSWGVRSGYRQKLDERNRKIRILFNEGCSLEELAERYYLSVHSIRKIVYQK